MRLRAAAPVVLSLLAIHPAPAGAASLPPDQTFVSSQGGVSMLTRSGGRAFVTARTRCGRVSDQRVRVRGGRISTPGRARVRISGRVLSRSRVRLTLRRGSCTRTYTLRVQGRPV
jgi:hypothetical protein